MQDTYRTTREADGWPVDVVMMPGEGWAELWQPASPVPTASERCAEIRRMVAARGWTAEVEQAASDALAAATAS